MNRYIKIVMLPIVLLVLNCNNSYSSNNTENVINTQDYLSVFESNLSSMTKNLHNNIENIFKQILKMNEMEMLNNNNNIIALQGNLNSKFSDLQTQLNSIRKGSAFKRAVREYLSVLKNMQDICNDYLSKSPKKLNIINRHLSTNDIELELNKLIDNFINLLEKSKSTLKNEYKKVLEIWRGKNKTSWFW